MTEKLSVMLAQTLKESLDCVVAPDVRDEVISVAMRYAGLSDFPDTSNEFAIFVRDAVFVTLEQIVGQKTATMALQEFSRLAVDVDMEESSEIRTVGEISSIIEGQQHSSGPVQRPTLGASAAERDTTRHERSRFRHGVLVASKDAQALREIHAQLGNEACVIPIDDVLGLVTELRDHPFAGMLIVIDGDCPSVGIPTLVAMGPDLPKNVPLLLWRLDRRDRKQYVEHYENNPNWIDMGARSDVASLIETSRELFEILG